MRRGLIHRWRPTTAAPPREGTRRRPSRHFVLCTATPHSGVESAFYSLLALLNPEFGTIPEGLGGPQHEQLRRLARHFVQRRRGDVVRFSSERADFPKRVATELPYTMCLPTAHCSTASSITRLKWSAEPRARNTPLPRQRVRWWAALALLRCVGSSPMAAAAALRTRAGGAADAEGDVSEIDERGLRSVFDQESSESADEDDAVPGADTIAAEAPDTRERRRLLDMAREAEQLAGNDDRKLTRMATELETMLNERVQPHRLLRYIATANYVAEELTRRLNRSSPPVTVEAVTGMLPPEVRRQRVELLGEAPKRVLVATDCLSEGIDLQHHFDAVIHYDLSWNPTRHEQRDGRVDRYAQPSPEVRSILVYGQDNPVDGAVLKVIIRKAKQFGRPSGFRYRCRRNRIKSWRQSLRRCY